MTYEELAPTISSLGITEIQVNSFLEKQSAVIEKTLPEVTKKKVTALANVYFPNRNWEESNGIAEAAGQVELTVGQVKEIQAEFDALKTAFDAPAVIE